MKFEKYPSLVRSDIVAKGSKLSKFLEGNDDTWYATEKVHGCNFAAYYNGNTFRFAKRTSFVDSSEDFFGFQEVFGFNEAFQEEEHPWANILKTIYADNNYQTVIVYGELFGGEIQDNVQYEQTLNNTKAFRAFNIFGYKGANTYDVFGYNTMKKYISEELLTPFATKGKFWDVLRELDMEAESVFGGISEGYVVQPYDDREWKSGDTFLGVKHKTHHFTEVAPAKLNDLIGRAATIEDLKRHLTDNRLDSIASKGYTMTRENMGEIMDVLFQDILDDYDGELVGDTESYKNQLRRQMAQLIYTHINRKSNLARK